MENGLISAVTVGNLLPIAQYSFDIGEFIQEKGLMNVVTVGSLLLLIPPFIIIREFKEFTSLFIREFKQKKGLMNAVNVGSLLPLIPPFIIIREFTQQKSHMTASDVGILLAKNLSAPENSHWQNI